MPERPYSRYTRAKTWAALYSQHINAGYALVPYSATNNSIAIIKCKSSEEVQATMQDLLAHADECNAFYSAHLTPDKAPTILARARHAVVLSRSSDYYHYHLDSKTDIRLVACGLHDSYLHLPVWEMRTNKRYGARETIIDISSPDFERARKTQVGHSILLGALHNGDKVATSYLEGLKKRQERSYWRIRAEVDAMQDAHYRGRPLAFMTDTERQEIGSKISAGLKKYHEQRRLHIV